MLRINNFFTFYLGSGASRHIFQAYLDCFRSAYTFSTQNKGMEYAGIDVSTNTIHHEWHLVISTYMVSSPLEMLRILNN